MNEWNEGDPTSSGGYLVPDLVTVGKRGKRATICRHAYRSIVRPHLARAVPFWLRERLYNCGWGPIEGKTVLRFHLSTGDEGKLNEFYAWLDKQQAVTNECPGEVKDE